MAGKADLAAIVAGTLDLSKAQADTVVTAVVTAITGLTADGSRLTLRDFGSFVKKTSAARICRSPQTGAEISVPAKTKLTFKAAK